MHFGLIGKSLVHSFSKAYFSEKFSNLNQDHHYWNCELESIKDFPDLLRHRLWTGFNVTIPYKESIIPYLDHLSEEAQRIGAVNTIHLREGKLIGFNTDFLGFKSDLIDFLSGESPKRALVLGSGGAAKAVLFALGQMDIQAQLVGREAVNSKWDYQQASAQLAHFRLVINCSPLGTFPLVEEKPDLELKGDLSQHFFYDLIYNPAETRFLSEAKALGAKTRNGQQMLVNQAEAAWDIWTKI